MLIGGLGKDKLNGGKGDDLLIGGYTSYDDHVASLELIMAEWGSVRSYYDRLNNLRNAAGPVLSGTSVGLKKSGSEQTVFNDSDKDDLKGSSNQDWFFASLGKDKMDDKRDEAIDAI